MSRHGLAFALIALLVAAPGVVRAQELNLARLDLASPNLVSVRTGAEYGLVADAGYARAVGLLGGVVLLGGELTAPWSGLAHGDFRLRATALLPVASGERWKLAASFAPTLRGASNDAGRFTGFGADLGAVGGYFAPGWFAAAELGLDWTLATRVVHSDAYRRLVFAGARDGWYADTAATLRAGAQLGVSFGRHDLVLRLGGLRDAGGAKPLLPIYATLGFGTRW